MNVFGFVQKNVFHHFSSVLLCVLLTSFGTAIFCLLLLLTTQLDTQLKANSQQIDLVVGAKGSPLQLILNSIYHVDYPTGNIRLKDADAIAKNPMVRLAVPLSMGDNYHGYRIIGTDSSFLALYESTMALGRWGTHDFEAVIGAQVAQARGLKLGDKIIGGHGLTASMDLHTSHPYTVTGILTASKNVTDHLVLTNLSSVWHMHEAHTDQPEDDAHDERKSLMEIDHADKEITSLLIQYKNPMAVALFPRMVNQNTNMQAASPAMESARLFAMMGLGLDALNVLAALLMAIASLSIFISLYNAFESRKYELAIMRTIGASRWKLFFIMLLEGLYITLIGSGLGIGIGHLALACMRYFGHQLALDPWQFYLEEAQIVSMAVAMGLFASLIPAMKAYLTTISATLSQ